MRTLPTILETVSEIFTELQHGFLIASTFPAQKYIPNSTYAYAGFGAYVGIVFACLAWSIKCRARYMLVLIISAAFYAAGLFLRTGEFEKFSVAHI
jgi:hypothetical protein